jgi:uncharacterized protein
MRRSAILALVLVATGARAQSYPPFTGRVIDLAGVVDGPSRKALHELSEHLDKASLAQLVVVVVPPEDLGSAQRTEYANELFRQFKLGHGPDQNDGLLLLFVTGPAGHRGVKVEVGYDLEGILPDGRVGWLTDTAAGPLVRKGDYAGAAVELASALARETEAAGPQRHGRRRARVRAIADRSGSILGIVFLVAGAIVIVTSGRRRRMPRYSLAALAVATFCAAVKATFWEHTYAGAAALVLSPVLAIAWVLFRSKACGRCGRWVVTETEVLRYLDAGRKEVRLRYECTGVASGLCDYKGEQHVIEAVYRMSTSSTATSSGKAEGSPGGGTLREGGGGASGGGGADREY